MKILYSYNTALTQFTRLSNTNYMTNKQIDRADKPDKISHTLNVQSKPPDTLRMRHSGDTLPWTAGNSS